MERYYSQELFKFLLNTFQNIFLKKLKKKNPFVACKCKQQSDVIVWFSNCSIDQMSEAIRFAIEKRQKLKQELVLQQEDFLINTVSEIQNLSLESILILADVWLDLIFGLTWNSLGCLLRKKSKYNPYVSAAFTAWTSFFVKGIWFSLKTKLIKLNLSQDIVIAWSDASFYCFMIILIL